MAVVPFRWQGATRVEQLRSLLATRADEWSPTWTAPSVSMESTFVPLLDEMLPSQWYEVRGAAGRVTVALAANAFERLGCYLIGAVAADEHGFATGLGRKSLDDFLRSLVRATPAESGLMPVERTDRPLQLHQGVASFLWTLAGLRIALFLDPVLCNALAPPEQVQRKQLTRRQDAILPAEVRLHAILDLGHTGLEHTVDLRPGDVIKTNVTLDAQVRLQSEPDHGDAFSGTLVAFEGQRAFRLSEHPHIKKGRQ